MLNEDMLTTTWYGNVSRACIIPTVSCISVDYVVKVRHRPSCRSAAGPSQLVAFADVQCTVKGSTGVDTLASHQ